MEARDIFQATCSARVITYSPVVLETQRGKIWPSGTNTTQLPVTPYPDDSSHSRENQPRKLPDINTSPNNIGGVLAEYPSDDPKSVLVVVLTIYQTWYIRTREQSQDDNLDVKSDNETNTPEDVFIPFTEDSHTCRSP
ncbi:hypothetical protein H112_06403 [Trichophyton rubrum D6]|nr:hypothetical protein H104_06396 [Trichophyton rubrum CBS 289.86]KDB31237.1 hypothetical protein H112_06403 [Trichophyton rubrum D6]